MSFDRGFVSEHGAPALFGGSAFLFSARFVRLKHRNADLAHWKEFP
jgi:hypothetical protein